MTAQPTNAELQAALARVGVESDEWQTGGGCMNVAVPLVVDPDHGNGNAVVYLLFPMADALEDTTGYSFGLYNDLPFREAAAAVANGETSLLPDNADDYDCEGVQIMVTMAHPDADGIARFVRETVLRLGYTDRVRPVDEDGDTVERVDPSCTYSTCTTVDDLARTLDELRGRADDCRADAPGNTYRDGYLSACSDVADRFGLQADTDEVQS